VRLGSILDDATWTHSPKTGDHTVVHRFTRASSDSITQRETMMPENCRGDKGNQPGNCPDIPDFAC
jgi:hypothetical protein